MTREQDHARVTAALKIDSLRRGANGRDANADNAANYDESKASLYPTLPDPLQLNSGERVTTAEVWRNVRRAELFEKFDRELYGRVPADVPTVRWAVASVEKGMNSGTPVVTKNLVGHVDNSAYPLIEVNIEVTLSTPANATGPVPVIMQFTSGRPFPFNRPPPPGPSWQEQVLARGWGYAQIKAATIQDDNGAGLTQGIIGLVNKGQPRSHDDWGSLRAWAWGASRALDYFETDDAIDATKVGLEGHSRWGKATLVAMAYDERFAIAYVSSSGEGGASLYRRYYGELVENIAAPSEYHWMAENFLKYAGPLSWDDLPVDAHELVALCAPRPVFISGGNEGDLWVDPKGMFLAAAGAQPVYELLGKRGMGTDQFPPLEHGLMDGDIAFRQHAEGHTDRPNWPTFLDFASRYF